MMWIRQLGVLVLLLTTNAKGGGSSFAAGAVKTHTISVKAVDASSSAELAGARVFVLARSGRELVATTTDIDGRASLSVPMGDDPPRYVFVEKDGYFVSGTRWRKNASEYYILVTVVELP